jgi:hypothetical protein
MPYGRAYRARSTHFGRQQGPLKFPYLWCSQVPRHIASGLKDKQASTRNATMRCS